jgi:hypothetical protein
MAEPRHAPQRCAQPRPDDLLFGHLYRAVVNPSTRHAPRGMTLGTVDEDWAKRRHPKWTRHPNP